MELSIKEVIKRTAKEIFNNEVIFFVGAGISKPSGAPLANEIVDGVINHLFEHHRTTLGKKYGELKNICLSESRPETLFNYIETYRAKAADATIDNSIDDLFSSIKDLKPTYFHWFLAILLGTGFVKSIITLNYDTLIEKACKEIIGREPKVYSKPEHFESFEREVENEILLLKMHGSLSTTDEQPLQLAIRQLIPLDPRKAQAINWFIKNKSFVFLGCSGNDDFDFTPIFVSEQANKTFYWINHQTASVINPSRQNQLYYPKSVRIITEQNNNSKDARHYHITMNTKDFIHELASLIEQEAREHNKAFPQLEDHEEHEYHVEGFSGKLDDWMNNLPVPLKNLVLANILKDMGFRDSAVEVLKTNIDSEHFPLLFFESRILECLILHEMGRFDEAIFNFEKLEKRLSHLTDKNNILFLCRTYKQRAFVYRDMALRETNESSKAMFWEQSKLMFDKWEQKILFIKNDLEYDEYQSNLYEVNRDKAWLLRDQGRLVEAIELMQVERFPDIYNRAKVCIDAGWFNLDEAKRRHLKKMDDFMNFAHNAEELFKQAIKFAEAGGYVDIKAQSLRSLSHVYLFQAVVGSQAGNLEDLQGKAEESLTESLRLYDALGIKDEYAVTLQDLALFYNAINEPLKASEYIKNAVKILEETKLSHGLLKAREIKDSIENGRPYMWYLVEMIAYLIK